MNLPVDRTRRTLLVSALGAATGLAALGTTGCGGHPGSRRSLQFSSLAAAEEEVVRLAGAQTLITTATWNWALTLAHCAQSIEYSMAGFPQPKPVWFQHTLGAAAFGVFAWRGRMTHDLAEPIPGAPALEPGLEPAQALLRLHQAIARFRQWPGPLQPHFAYGALDKPAYEQAHAMHLADHLSSFHSPG